jgi:hypothetical protein
MLSQKVCRDILPRPSSAFLHEKSYLQVGFFPFFSPRMTGPDHHATLRSCAFLATGKECSWSLHGYDCS